MDGSAEAIRRLVQPVLDSSGLELWDVELERHTIRVLVDRSGGVDLDALAMVAGQVISPLLDEHPELTPEGQFQLEVSSPGVERTLRSVEQFERYIGSPVSIKTTVPVSGARRHQGQLLAADAEGVTVAPDDAPEGTTVHIPHTQISRARTVLVWGPSARPGGKGSKAVKRPAASGRQTAATPVASNDAKDSES